MLLRSRPAESERHIRLRPDIAAHKHRHLKPAPVTGGPGVVPTTAPTRMKTDQGDNERPSLFRREPGNRSVACLARIRTCGGPWLRGPTPGSSPGTKAPVANEIRLRQTTTKWCRALNPHETARTVVGEGLAQTLPPAQTRWPATTLDLRWVVAPRPSCQVFARAKSLEASAIAPRWAWCARGPSPEPSCPNTGLGQAEAASQLRSQPA